MTKVNAKLRFVVFSLCAITVAIVVFFVISIGKKFDRDREFNEISFPQDSGIRELIPALDTNIEFRFRSSFNVGRDGIFQVVLHRPKEATDLIVSDFRLAFDSSGDSLKPVNEAETLMELSWKDVLVSELSFNVIDRDDVKPDNLEVIYRGQSYAITPTP